MKNQWVLFILSISSLAGCCGPEFEVPCPGFPEEQLVYFDYKVGNTLTYLSDKGNEIIFVLKTAVWTEPFTCMEQKCYDNSPNCYCFANADFRLYSDDFPSLVFEAFLSEIRLDTVFFEPSITFNISDTTLMLEDYLKFSHGAPFDLQFLVPGRDTLLSQVEIGGKIYEDVYYSVKDTTQLPPTYFSVWKMYFQKGKGVLQFFEKENQEIWTLKDD